MGGWERNYWRHSDVNHVRPVTALSKESDVHSTVPSRYIQRPLAVPRSISSRSIFVSLMTDERPVFQTSTRAINYFLGRPSPSDGARPALANWPAAGRRPGPLSGLAMTSYDVKQEAGRGRVVRATNTSSGRQSPTDFYSRRDAATDSRAALFSTIGFHAWIFDSTPIAFFPRKT